MKAEVGDRLVVHGHRLGERDRDAEIREVMGNDGQPPFRARWSDDWHARGCSSRARTRPWSISTIRVVKTPTIECRCVPDVTTTRAAPKVRHSEAPMTRLAGVPGAGERPCRNVEKR